MFIFWEIKPTLFVRKYCREVQAKLQLWERTRLVKHHCKMDGSGGDMHAHLSNLGFTSNGLGCRVQVICSQDQALTTGIGSTCQVISCFKLYSVTECHVAVCGEDRDPFSAAGYMKQITHLNTNDYGSFYSGACYSSPHSGLILGSLRMGRISTDIEAFLPN